MSSKPRSQSARSKRWVRIGVRSRRRSGGAPASAPRCRRCGARRCRTARTPCWITRSDRSTRTGSLKMPSRLTRPPRSMHVERHLERGPAPLISSTTSTPSPLVASRMAAAVDGSRGVERMVAPIVRPAPGDTARCRWRSRPMRRPPARCRPRKADRAAAGDENVRPSIGSTKAACTALPIGSWSATTAGSRPLLSIAFSCGMTTYSAKPPSTCAPMTRRLRQRCGSPRRQTEQVQSTRWLSTPTRSPSRTRVTALAGGDHAARKLVAEHCRWPHDVLRPRVPRVEVVVGAADRGGLHAEQHLARSGSRDRPLDELGAGCGPRLGERAHGARRSGRGHRPGV